MILSQKHYQAIELILEGRENSLIAKTLGVSTKTLANWKNDPVFRAELNKFQHEIFETICRRLISTEKILHQEAMRILKNSKDDNVKTRLIGIMYKNIFSAVSIDLTNKELRGIQSDISFLKNAFASLENPENE